MNEALKPYLAGSTGLHAAAVVAFAVLAPMSVKKADKVYMIDFVGGPAVVQQVTSAAEAAKAGPTETVAARPEQQAEKDTFATKKGRFVLPRPSLLKGWTESKEPPKPSLGASGDSKAAPAAAGPASGMPGSAAGVATDRADFPYPWYISQVRQMLWVAWQKRMPAAAGEGVVVFSIVRNGSYTDLRMESSSGDSTFDDAAIASVQASAPFPPLPSDFAEPFLKIHLTLKSEPSWR